MSNLIKASTAALIAGAMAMGVSTVLHARDPGINQPGAAGNVHRDRASTNPARPGTWALLASAGTRDQPARRGRDVGAPGVGRDPGSTSPARPGTSALRLRQSPGINQPGAAGNRRRVP